jgi:hypothetical protein
MLDPIFFFSGLPRWRNGQACRIGPYPSVHDDSEEAYFEQDT